MLVPAMGHLKSTATDKLVFQNWPGDIPVGMEWTAVSAVFALPVVLGATTARTLSLRNPTPAHAERSAGKLQPSV
ncbi:hypothetical protein PUR34_36550 [Streptomyces sp. JV185]|uniref:hypothetical protein n=1 Tax=Streptomyces sp. JV185 TaxID=858638 RepID=UPI002E770AFF|nr:hypothetical protein [Streptomyces sp. JV185]MEE1773532.1 hypothetical protein [Streptomyces sp. JV185]